MRPSLVTIREYVENEHPAKFIGLRVVVKVGSDYRQKYFSFKSKKYSKTLLNDKEVENIRQEAKALNNTWNMERNFTQTMKERECKEKRRSSSAYTTGVSGIKMKFAAYGRHTPNKQPKEKQKTYYTAVFKVSGSTNNTRFDKSYNINALGYDMAWLKAVMYYAKQKNLSSFDHLLKRKPPVEQFLIIYKHQCAQGHDIPLRRLPEEIDSKLVDKMT